LSSPGRMSPEPCKTPMANPDKSADTPLRSKRVRRVSPLSPITPQNSIDKIGNRGRNQPKAKLVGRFTRSMAKTTSIKTPVIDKVQVETVVLDEEEFDISSPIDDNVVQPEVVSNPVNETLPVIDKDIPVLDKEVREDSFVNAPTKEKPVHANSPGVYCVANMAHPLFINRLLDKIRSMEDRVGEMAVNRDLIKAENAMLKEKVNANDQQLLRLRNHKNKLIRRVLKLQDENDKNEERVRELNAQIALMQFRVAPSPSHSSGVNIQVFNAPVNL